MPKHIDKRKTLYSLSGYRYGKDGITLYGDTRNAIRSVFFEYIHKGYNPREIARVMMASINDIELDCIIDIQPKDDKEHDGI